MESHQLKMLPNASVIANSLNFKPNSLVMKPGDLPKKSGVHRNGNLGGKEESFGFLEVYIHQARDIHNICIYHKQDVYAKIYLTNDPETTFSTPIINGGGQNPVFNETLKLNIQTIESSLKCEIWMLSRVRNYLEDQLLGFATVPLCEVVAGNGRLEREFSLSSSDIFHSAAGFVKLTLTYTGSSPEGLEIPSPHSTVALNCAGQDSEIPISVPCELEKIEFPDPKIANENEMMVSEYFGISNANLECTREEQTNVECGRGSVEVSKIRTPSSGVSTTESPSSSIPVTTQSASDTQEASKVPNQDDDPLLGEKIEDCSETVISVTIEPEQKVVQQEIVDMYMKSMQQFTESLAKMKLPLDMENVPADSGGTCSDEKVQASKSTGRSPRVFYGSRAFF